MPEIIVQQWGGNLAILVPSSVVTDAGLTADERIDVSTLHGQLMLRRIGADASADARAAAEEIIEESKTHTLGLSVKVLLNEGRRG